MNDLIIIQGQDGIDIVQPQSESVLILIQDVLSGGGSGSGSVTSVGLALPNIFTVMNSPVTVSGTLTGTLASQTQNLIFASPNGSSGVPSFRALVNADIPSLNYEVPLIFSTGLTRTTNTITVNSSQNISTLSNLTTNGFVKTSGGTGALSIDTSTYLTANQAITLSGDVSGSGSTSITTAIGNDRVLTANILNSNVTLAKIANIATATILGNNSGISAAPLALTAAQTKTLLAIANTDVSGLGTLSTQNGTFSGTSSGVNSGDQTITLTGDVTGSGTGSFAATIAANAIVTSKITDSNVTLAKIANIADQTILGNNSGGSAAPIALTSAQTKTILSLSNVENTALSTWAGSTNLTTLGTIATGTWAGTTVAVNHGGSGATTLTGVLIGNGTSAFTAVAIPADASKFLDGTGAFSVPAGGGDMVLASVQTVTGAKTFNNAKLLLENVAGTFNGSFTNTNTANRIYTLKDAPGTLAFTSDITGTNSGVNTGDQTITLTSDVTGSGTGSFATTIASGAVTLAKMANMATSSLIYRRTAGTGVPEVNTLAQLKTDFLSTGLDMGSQKITSVTDPTSAQDAATKNYVDNTIANFDSKPSVAYASTSALPANTYSNGSSGVGATLTGNVNGPLVIDGVTTITGQAGERVLIAGESTQANNGWYTITQIGVVAVSPYILTRATESDQSTEIGAGYVTSVIAPNTVTPGSSNNGKVFISVASDPFTVGTTALTFSQVGATYSAGTGLGLSGNTFSLSTPVSVGNGGVGVGTLASNGILYGNGASAVQALAVNSSATNKFLTQSSSAAPAWATLVSGDIPNNAANTTGSAATLTTPRAINGTNFDGSAGITITAAAGTLTGTTLNATVTASSLVSVGTLTGGATGAGFTIALTTSTVTGTLTETHGGTNQTTYATGDTLYASASNTLSKLAVGTTNQILSVTSGIPAWQNRNPFFDQVFS